MIAKLDAFRPHALSLVRAVSALTFMAHGTMKILHFPASEKIPEVGSLPWTAGLFELILGFTLFLGLGTRISAFVLSGVMAFAYFLVHAPKSFFPVLNGGDAAILYSFIFLYFVFSGPGSVALDNVLFKKRSA
ncbi:DoxX family protein [Rhizobium sp. MHM7A]|uniref:DoxX family protein n=1 Tax=Rhizobium sp. MHM7A TaxID=2583233 RepID=UPI0011058CD3|nr:DoxX family protein [Rhizobium sp. MHM7A]TLX17102.1 DoxX family protein [Rhizobium sp. MHM7A]